MGLSYVLVENKYWGPTTTAKSVLYSCHVYIYIQMCLCISDNCPVRVFELKLCSITLKAPEMKTVKFASSKHRAEMAYKEPPFLNLAICSLPSVLCIFNMIEFGWNIFWSFEYVNFILWTVILCLWRFGIDPLSKLWG